jgi:hypothetical protein
VLDNRVRKVDHALWELGRTKANRPRVLELKAEKNAAILLANSVTELVEQRTAALDEARKQTIPVIKKVLGDIQVGRIEEENLRAVVLGLMSDAPKGAVS